MCGWDREIDCLGRGQVEFDMAFQLLKNNAWSESEEVDKERSLRRCFEWMMILGSRLG